MATHVHLLSALLTAADRRFLQDPPRLLDFVPGTTPTHPLLLPTLRNASLQQYIRTLRSLSQRASEPSPNVPVRVLSHRAHILWNIELRLNNIGQFVRFCYKRQLNYCASPCTSLRSAFKYFSLANPLEEIEFDFHPYSPPASPSNASDLLPPISAPSPPGKFGASFPLQFTDT